MSKPSIDHNELLSQLRVLPRPQLDEAFAEETRRQALLALVKPVEKRVIVTPPVIQKSWKIWVELIAERVVLPVSLAGTTAAYLMWAIDAASRVYR
ncbi:MAG: hypothetical protein U0165_09645 [Polyangiaceae bacterium]